MSGRGGTGEIVDLIDFQEDRQRHVVADQLEVRTWQQVGDVRLLAGEEVVEADHVVPAFQQPFAKMNAEKARPAGDQDALDGGHGSDLHASEAQQRAFVGVAVVGLLGWQLHCRPPTIAPAIDRGNNRGLTFRELRAARVPCPRLPWACGSPENMPTASVGMAPILFQRTANVSRIACRGGRRGGRTSYALSCGRRGSDSRCRADRRPTARRTSSARGRCPTCRRRPGR